MDYADNEVDYVDNEVDYVDNEADYLDNQVDYLDNEEDYVDNEVDYLDHKVDYLGNHQPKSVREYRNLKFHKNGAHRFSKSDKISDVVLSGLDKNKYYFECKIEGGRHDLELKFWYFERPTSRKRR